MFNPIKIIRRFRSRLAENRKVSKSTVFILFSSLILGMLLFVAFDEGIISINLKTVDVSQTTKLMPSKSPIKEPTPQPSIKEPFSATKLWELVQDWRKSNNMRVYKEDQTLCDIAKVRVNEIKTDWSHDGFNNRFIGKDHPFDYIGENLSRDFYTESETLQAWLNSPEHRENLDKPYTHSCIVCENNLCTQMFGRYSNPNDIEECYNPNCGSIRIPKNQCSDTTGYVCCQLGDKWVWYESRVKCGEDQKLGAQ